MAENIRVAVRIRPENSTEARGSHSIVVRPLDEEGLVFDPDENYNTQSSGPNCYRRKARDVHFHFDRVFDEQSTQQDVFEGTAKTILDGIFSGFNCSVLAYGATGAGKTHTMLGSEECPGLIFLIMMELYRRMDEVNEEKICNITISYLEVYNETIRDLLKPTSHALAVREDPQKGVVVSQLSTHKPSDAHDLLRMLSTGNNNRTQHPTDANATSSRSHAVFQVVMQQKPRTAGLSAEVRTAKLLLVDLAGSERATVSRNRGDRQREGANINRSLLALGNCINALAAGNSKSHIPYRDSKLTRLLKDSLGGNCRTAFIANVGPSTLSYEDTLNTLRYAERAKKIKVKLSENRTKIDFHATRYRSIVADLQKEVADLKRRLKQTGGGDPAEKANSVAACQLLQKVQTETRDIINGKLALRQRLRDIQASQRDNITLSLRTSRLKARVQCLMPDDKRILHKLDTRLATLGERQEGLDEQFAELQGQLKENASRWSASYSNAIASMTVLANKVQWLRPSIQQVLDARRLEVHEVESARELKHLRHFANSQKLDAENTETLVQRALRLIQHQQRRLVASGSLTDDLQQSYSTLIRTVQGAKSLAWADGQSTAMTPRHSLNKSFIESSPFEKLRQHRQMLAAALQSPPHLSDELSPMGEVSKKSGVSHAASHEHVGSSDDVGDGVGMTSGKAVSQALLAQSGSNTSINSKINRMPTRGIMATPGTSLFRSPGETPPTRPAFSSQPTTPQAAGTRAGAAAMTHAHSSSSIPTSVAASQHASSYSPVCSSAGNQPVLNRRTDMTVPSQTPMRHVYYAAPDSPLLPNSSNVLTSTPGVGLLARDSAKPAVLPPAALAFTPVISRAEIVSTPGTSAFSHVTMQQSTEATAVQQPERPGSTSPSPDSSVVLQPAYMTGTSSHLVSRRGQSSTFFTTPTIHNHHLLRAQQLNGVHSPHSPAIPSNTTTQAPATGLTQNDNIRRTDVEIAAEDMPLPPSPETFVLSSPVNGAAAVQENALDCTITLPSSPTQQHSQCGSSPDGDSATSTSSGQGSRNGHVPAFLPPPPPGLKGARQRVRGVIEPSSRPSNVGINSDDMDDYDADQADANVTFTTKAANTTFTANPASGNTFLVDQTATVIPDATARAAAVEAPAIVPAGAHIAPLSALSSTVTMATGASGLSGAGLGKGTKGQHQPGSSSRAASAGSMSLTASLQTKPSGKSSRPSTYNGTGRKQNFSSLTASARAKQMPVRGRADENADPHLGAPKRPPYTKGSGQLEAFKAKLNSNKSTASSGTLRTSRKSRQN
eukprot:scpid8576/ scgid22827/ Kinesin-like protein KIF18A; Marrow stromal KIF18A